MGRKARPALQGLEALGSRLKYIRLHAGMSQMNLAGLIGFDPAHGYKYIIRLEKGKIPNPTLRTIAACLEACEAQWQDIADVLPATGTVGAKVASPLPITAAPDPGPMAAGPRPVSNRTGSTSATAHRKDARPQREQLRSRRLQEHDERTRLFWSGFKQAEAATMALLRSMRVPSSMSRAYVAFTRSCCLTFDALKTARPEVAERELAKLVKGAVAQGLDARALAQIQLVCAQVTRSPSTAR